MKHKLGVLPAVVFFFAQQAAAEEYQVLGLELPGANQPVQVADSSNPGGDQDNERCGDYRLTKVALLAQPGSAASSGTVNVLDPQKKTITMKSLAGGENASVRVSLVNSKEKPVDQLQVLLLQLNEENGSHDVISRAVTNSNGEATFEKAVQNGAYQVALDCAAPVAAWVPGAGSIGAVGVTALAVGLSSDSGSSGVGLGNTRTDSPGEPPFSAPQQSPSP